MPFCKDCRHCRWDDTGIQNARCDATRRDTTDLVTGEPKVERKFCSTARIFGQECGPGGKLFEPAAREAA